jgi:RNA polymerase sigma-70 factor (ECF subfamily)
LDTTDAELVEKCRRGDREAWEIIVRRRHSRIYNLAYRFTGRFDEAEDLTQEVFLKVYRTLHSYRPESGALETWIVRVARNHFIDHYRKYKTERIQALWKSTMRARYRPTCV